MGQSFLTSSMLCMTLITVNSVLSASPSTLSRRAMTVHERRSDVPYDFTRVGSPHPDTVMNFRIGLAAKDMRGLEKALYDVSTPGSPSYGQHLSADEIKNYVSATSESTAAVTEWLNEHGITDINLGSTFNNWMSFSTSVSTASYLFNTDFHSFIHKRSGERFVRTLEYSIPRDLLHHIEVVHPTTSFGAAKMQPLTLAVSPVKERAVGIGRRDNVSESCADLITPQCLQELYGIPSTPATQSSNRLAVPGEIDFWAQEADLEQFLETLRPDMPSNTTFSLETIDGGSNPQGPGLAGPEANLDIQYTVGLATGVPVTFVSIGENFTDNAIGFLDIAEYLNNQTSPPQVMSMSYGYDEDWLTPALAQRVCNAYMALGARGVSVIFGSGDGGVSGTMFGNDTCTEFRPPFPGGCPYITSVGGTYSINPEIATNFSTGGFSNVFPRPSYQEVHVQTFLEGLGDTYAGKYNASGRAMPDVATQAHNFEVITNGEVTRVNGTSAAGPVFASLVALVNDRLVKAGKPTLGFLNPFLYANPQMFTDITSGNNPGCSTPGFNATIGWDPITGLGTPQFARILEAAGLKLED